MFLYNLINIDAGISYRYVNKEFVKIVIILPQNNKIGKHLAFIQSRMLAIVMPKIMITIN